MAKLLRSVKKAVADSVDPATEWLEKVGDITGIDVFLNMVLVVTYIRPKISKGGIHLADTTLKEDEYQGKVGLVLKKGPLAYVDDKVEKFAGCNVNPGDWVVYHALDGWQLKINGVHCRMLQDVHIKSRVKDPSIVY